MQLGIDIDAYTYPGQDISVASQADISYAKSLGANAVSISFPVFMHGRRSSTVYTSSRTISPDQLGSIVGEARKAGLYVSARPLLDEASLGESRTNWKPRHPRAWFASYRRVLLPYAAAAQRAGADEFFLGAEFTRFAANLQWTGLRRALETRFHGTIAYANNGDMIERGTAPGSGITVDAYPSLPMGPAASVRQLAAAWYAYDQMLKPGTILSEVGIDAVRGAYAGPWRHHWDSSRMSPVIQYRWFAAACRAATRDRLGGIYFWQIPLSTRLPGPSQADQGNWAHSDGARAVRNCFTQAHGRQP